MPSYHSVHDLELAVQDLWTHLPQDNIRFLINSMPDRVAACIAAGGRCGNQVVMVAISWSALSSPIGTEDPRSKDLMHVKSV
ncbi:hypothetical protein TNCV_3430971 [Trichonephila clavipes]|nr:hypothetical protein TNCV_3430971 [Trichonephila clavipes]